MQIINFIILMTYLVGFIIKGEYVDFPSEFSTIKSESDELKSDLLAKHNGCVSKWNGNNTVLLTGFDCYFFNISSKMQPENLIIKATKIQRFRKNDFSNLKNLKTLEIRFNSELKVFEKQCFSHLKNLRKLTISFNNHFKLYDDIFEGLVNLRELNMLKNEFTRIYDITKVLTKKYVPNLTVLNLNENMFETVYVYDFVPMKNLKLLELHLELCQIENMHEKSLNPLKNLQSLYIGQNMFDEMVITNVLSQMNKQSIPLNLLNLADAGFRRTLPYKLLSLVAKMNLTNLNLSHNVFDNLNNNSFPYMPNIITLDMSNCLLMDIGNCTFDNLPNLTTLLLNENRLGSITPGVTIKNLKILDMSRNSGNLISRSYFRIEDNSFINMNNLIELQLAYNLITQITNLTFNGLSNLKYLGLKNATIFNLDKESFSNLNKLEYLNLESNKFTMILNKDTFKGLSSLKTLLLGACSIEKLHNPFYYLKNLEYLGLQSNSLYAIDSFLFRPVLKLRNINLSQNKLLEWTERIFTNLSVVKLDLSQNKIKILTESMLEDFSTLNYLYLEGNPFTCDCMLEPVHKWLTKRNFSFEYILNDGLKASCVNPEEWSQLSIFEYIFYINIINSDECIIAVVNIQIILISLLTVLSLLVIILSITGYIYRSHLRHWILLTRMAFRRYLRTFRKKPFHSETTIFKYDAFVSYSNEDQSFIDQLIEMLEKQEPYFKLCVYDRDFQIGSAICESVLNSVANSKRTLLIISDSFAKSQWCRWEAKLAEQQHLFFHDGDIKDPGGTLLMILLEDVHQKNMTPTLKYLLKTRIYLKWSKDINQQKIFWDKLRKKLASCNNGSYHESCFVTSS